MISITFFLSVFLLVRTSTRIFKTPASFIYIAAMVVGAGVPLQFGSDYTLFIDMVTAASILIAFFTSSFSFNHGKLNYNSIIKRSNNSKVYLLIASAMFLLPGLVFGKFPIFVAIQENLLAANYVREEITKGSFAFSLYLTVVFRFGLMLTSFSIGFFFSQDYRAGRSLSIFALVIAAIVSVAYVQKSNPLFVLVAFFLGRLFSGTIKKKTIVLIAVLIPIQIYIMGQILYGGGGAMVFFVDITTRRMTDVPLETLASHFEYASQYGPLMLKNSFTFLTGNEALPRLVYSSLGGSLALGWANSLYVGDVFANFGLTGIVIVNVLLGLIIRMGNRAAVRSESWHGKTLGLFALGAFLLSLSNNALFSGVQVILSGIFVANYFFFRVRASSSKRNLPSEIYRY